MKGTHPKSSPQVENAGHRPRKQPALCHKFQYSSLVQLVFEMILLTSVTHHELKYFNNHDVIFMVGVGDGQGGLVCCSSWGCKESDATELN